MKSFRGKWQRLGTCFESGFRAFLVLLLAAYRTLGTTHLGGSCRFEPSCSQYAMEAVSMYPPWSALKLIFKRLLKCRPGGPFGVDPVPDIGRQRPVSSRHRNTGTP